MIRTRLRTRGGGGGSSGVPISPSESLPSNSTDNALLWSGHANQRYTSSSNITVSSGDFAIGAWVKPKNISSDGTIFHLGATPSSNNSLIFQVSRRGEICFGGKDSSGNALGTHAGPSATSSAAYLISKTVIPYDTAAFVVCQKVGNLAQIWIKFNGHAPMKVAEEYTSFNGMTATGYWFGIDRNYGRALIGATRNFFKVSYSLTKDQIDKIGNGNADPEDFGTPASDDVRYLMNTYSAGGSNTWTDLINSLTVSQFLSGYYSLVTGVGYAPMTDAVFLDPIGGDDLMGGDGWVEQHTDGSATITFSGTYQGDDGQDIEVLLIDENDTSFSSWQTLDTATTGNVWSGSLSVSKKKRWNKVQMRKVGYTDVMTSTLRWGVGEKVMLSGQSLMEHMSSTSANYGATDVSLNGYVGFNKPLTAYGSLGGTEYNNITATANSSGEIEYTTQWRHGLRTGQYVGIAGVGGTTGGNNAIWQITVTANNKFVADGSSYNAAYTSGGYVYFADIQTYIANSTQESIPSGLAIIANGISNSSDCVVSIINKSYGGQAIEQFNEYGVASGANNYAFPINLAGIALKKLGSFLWLHGHQNIGQSSYFSSGGSAGAWTGYGKLGQLYDVLADMPNTDFKFGVAAFTSVAGLSSASASGVHEFRHGMKDWCDRKIASGNNNVFFLGWYNDMQPQWENGVTQNAHLTPTLKGYKSMAARLGHAVSYKAGGESNMPIAGTLTTAVRSGAVITLTVSLSGGTSLQAYENTLDPTGFEVSTASNFSTKATISSVAITGSNEITITLSSDPGATCYVRYQYGYVGDYNTSAYMTGRITGVADNGAGLIRVTTADPVTPATPSGSQRVGGHGLVTGQVIGIEGVAGATQANGVWRVTVIDAYNFDLQGSSSTGLGTFTANSNLWQSGATGVVAIDIGNPIYDDRTIGGYDTNGAPLAPTYTALVAT